MSRPPEMTTGPDVLKVGEVATLLRLGRRQTYEAIHRGEIPGCHKIGSSVRCSHIAVNRWLNGEEPNGNGWKGGDER